MPRCQLFILWILFFLANTVEGQTYIGFKAGITQSRSTLFFNIDPGTASKRGNLTGLYFSVPLDISINELLTFHPELAIASEGSLLTVFGAEENRVYNNALFYFKLPLLAKVNILKNEQYQFGVLAGLIPAYAIGIKSYYYPFFNIRKSIELPVSFEEANVQRFDLGISLGASIEKTIAKGLKVILEGRYSLGLVDIEENPNQTTTIESFNLTLGLLTPLFRSKNSLAFLEK